MYVTGSSKNIQYKKPDHTFYRGIVIDNQDPNKLMRVQVFIPELSNQPYEGWLAEYNNGVQTMIQPGSIGPLSNVNTDALKKLIPWAEQMAPLMGESGTSHYFASKGEQRSKATHVKTATQSTPPNSQTGGGMPRSTIANSNAATITDAWADGSLGKTNPTGGTGYAPKNSGEDSSGVYGIPQVGAHVWVFHYRGDLNYPVYFGTSSSYRDTALVFGKGESYPASFESNTGDSPSTSLSSTPTGGGSVSYEFGKTTTRNRTVHSDLFRFLGIAARATGVDVFITSGGQSTYPTGDRQKGDGNWRTPGGWTGSRRHDELTEGAGNGMAADFYIRLNGDKVPISNNAIWKDFVNAFKGAARAARYQPAGGAGYEYMGRWKVHLDIATGRTGQRPGETRPQPVTWHPGSTETTWLSSITS